MQNQKIIKHSFFLLAMLMLHMTVGYAQSDARIEAGKQIERLKEGKLLIVIPSHIKTLNELHRLSQSEELNSDQKAALKQRFDETIADRDSLHQELAEAFDELYTFSDYELIYDYQLRSKAPETNHAKAPPIKVSDLSSFTHRLRIGKTSEAQQFGVQAIILTDREGQDLTDPFPYYVKLNHRTWLNGLFSIFNPEGYRRRSGKELIERLNNKLEKFYRKVSEG